MVSEKNHIAQSDAVLNMCIADDAFRHSENILNQCQRIDTQIKQNTASAVSTE